MACPGDCGAYGGTCGDGYCGPGEDPMACPGDCGAANGFCGDGLCGPGEDTVTCDGDCNGTRLCKDDCLMQVDEGALAQYDALLNCSLAHCPACADSAAPGDCKTCAEEACPAETLACFGVPGGATPGCASIFACQDACSGNAGGNEPCHDLCPKPPAGSLSSALLDGVMSSCAGSPLDEAACAQAKLDCQADTDCGMALACHESCNQPQSCKGVDCPPPPDGGLGGAGGTGGAAGAGGFPNAGGFGGTDGGMAGFPNAGGFGGTDGGMGGFAGVDGGTGVEPHCKVDGYCMPGETPELCPADCGGTPPPVPAMMVFSGQAGEGAGIAAWSDSFEQAHELSWVPPVFDTNHDGQPDLRFRAYQYLASREVVDGGAFPGLSATGEASGLDETRAALLRQNIDPRRLGLRFPTLTLGDDLDGVDWIYREEVVDGVATHTETRRYRGPGAVILLDGQPILRARFETRLELVIDYGDLMTMNDDRISGDTPLFGGHEFDVVALDPLALELANALLTDLARQEGGVYWSFMSLQPALDVSFPPPQFGTYFDLGRGELRGLLAPSPCGRGVCLPGDDGSDLPAWP